MKKGIILCAGGYSSSIIAQKLNELGKGKISFDESGYGFDQSIDNFANKYDLIVLAPHLSMYYDDVLDDIEGKDIELLQIESSEYVATNVHKLYERIVSKLGL